MPRVVLLFGPKKGITREFDGVLRIGRAHDAELQLIDERVSRDHCTLEVTPQGTILRDLGSRNGTWLDGARVTAPVTLVPGARVAIGETLLAFEPELEALRSHGGEHTVVLTRGPTTSARRGAPGPRDDSSAVAQVAHALAHAADPTIAAQSLAEKVLSTFDARAVAVVSGGVNSIRRVVAAVGGVQLALPSELLQLALEEQRPISLAAAQTMAEVDEHTTRVRSTAGFVACAPLIRLSRSLGAICVERAKDFTEPELELLQSLAAAGSSVLDVPSAQPASERPIAESPSMREVLAQAEAAARVPSSVLLTGETGVGKEVVARFIHTSSARRTGPFVALNCGAIPSELAESELFGHERGAFTGAVDQHVGVFERAEGGTLLLDEVGELPLALQVKLLRVLQDRLVTRIGGRAPIPVDVRVIAATHRDLAAAQKAGTFREDLYWRLQVLPLKIPPLRERTEDVVPLALRFLGRFRRELGVDTQGFTPEAESLLKRCAWPGNVRQLANALERALVLKRSAGPIGVIDLPVELGASPRPGGDTTGRTLAVLIAELEREQISLALRQARGVKATAAEALGISRPTLDRKIQELDIDWVADAR